MSNVRAETMRSAWSAHVDDYPTALELSHDGAALAVGTAAGELLLLNVASGAVRTRWRAHEAGIQCLAWNTRALQLASGGQDGRLCLWRAEQGELQSQIRIGPAWVDHAAFNATGTLLACAAGKKLLVLSPNGETLSIYVAHESTVTGLAWRPNGTQVLTSCYGGLQAILASSGQLKRRWRWKGSLLNLALSPNGKVAACGAQDNTVHFWRLANGRDAMMAGYPAKPAALSWRVDGQLLATTGAASITIWRFAGNAPEGTRPLVLDGHAQLLSALAFAPRGAALASGCRQGRVMLWAPGRSATPIAAQSMSEAIAHVRWCSPGSAVGVIGADASGRIECWRV